MRAISIHEPYASLIIKGIKQFETRSWSTKIRGKIAIHAAKKPMDEEGKRLAEKYGVVPQYGKVLGIVDLYDCWKYFPEYPVRYPSVLKAIVNSKGVVIRTPITEFEFGHFEEGRFAWEMREVEKFENPIPAKGQQGFWNWEENDE